MASILVVDDSPDAIVLFSELLRSEGHDVHTATDWVSANAALRLELDLVLLDVNMPTLEGDKLAKILLTAKPELRIVLTSAMDESELRRRAREVGAAGAIPKGFDALFLNRIRRFLPE